MVRIGNRRLRLGGANEAEKKAQAAPDHAPAEQSPPLLMLLPDAVGIASYQCLAFPDAEAATSFMDDRFRGQIEDGMIAFWALTRDPNFRRRRAAVEPLLIIRDTRRAGVVYPFSFTDAAAAYDFIRQEMAHGLELPQVALYWAVTVRASVDAWGKSSLSPATPPASARPAATPAGPADAPHRDDHHLPLLEAWQSARRQAIGGPTRILRRHEQSPDSGASANRAADSANPADGAGDRPLTREPAHHPEENPETNGTPRHQIFPQASDLALDATPIAPRNGQRPLKGDDPATDADEAVTRAIEEALQIVRGERKPRRPRPDLREHEPSAGAGETDLTDVPAPAADVTGNDGPPDPSRSLDDLDAGALHDMINEIERFRRRQRREDQQGPFKGFGSPPGKF